jgi:hypothetical protein
MENDIIFATETSDMLTGAGADDIQIAAVPSASAPFDDALPRAFDAAQVVIPRGENVVRIPVGPGEVVELPFPSDAQFLARIDNGNLAIKVGDITVILQGYVEAAGQAAPVIEAANGQPLDIATILAATDPAVDIETASGPAAGSQGQGADNTGAILTQFGEGSGLSGFQGIGAQDDGNGTDGPGGGTVDQTGTLFRPFGDLAPAATGINTVPSVPVAVSDIVLTNVGTAASFAVPEWALLANDKDADHNASLDVGNVSDLISANVLIHTLGTGSNGKLDYYENATLGGSFKYAATDGTNESAPVLVTINNQAGGDITGTVADEILAGSSGSEKLHGGGGNDIVFSGGGSDEMFGDGGDDTLVFQTGSKFHGGTDSVASSGGLAADASNHGDVLVVGSDLKLADSAAAASYDGIETISMQEKFGGGGAQTLTIGAESVQQLSDHTITPGGLFGEHDAIRIDSDTVDQLYLSISKDGGSWTDTGVDAAGYHIFAHETTGGDAATTDAYVMVQTANTGNVHLNQDAP